MQSVAGGEHFSSQQCMQTALTARCIACAGFLHVAPGDPEARCDPPQALEDVLGVGDGSPFFLACHARRVLQLQPSAYRAAFIAVLRSSDALVATAAVRVLLALLMSRHIDSALLDAAGRWCSSQLLLVHTLTSHHLTHSALRRAVPPANLGCLLYAMCTTGGHASVLQACCRSSGGNSGICWMH